MSISIDNFYYEKYLKYKSKYLELKKSMSGAGSGKCKEKMCGCLEWKHSKFNINCGNEKSKEYGLGLCNHRRDQHE